MFDNVNKKMRFFAILIFGTIFLSLSASIFIAFKSTNKFEVDSENEFCMEIELNAKTILDPKVRLKIIELKRKLPRPNDGEMEKIDEKIIVCYQRVIRSESKFEFRENKLRAAWLFILFVTSNQ